MSHYQEGARYAALSRIRQAIAELDVHPIGPADEPALVIHRDQVLAIIDREMNPKESER